MRLVFLLIDLLIIIAHIWSYIAICRFFLQKGGLHVSHPLASFCCKFTNFIVNPARKIFKPIFGWDVAILYVVLFFLILVYTFNVVLKWVFYPKLIISFKIFSYILFMAFIDFSASFCNVLIFIIALYYFLPNSYNFNSLKHCTYNLVDPLVKFCKNFGINNYNFSLLLLVIVLFIWNLIILNYLRGMVQLI